jgi:geranylgeranyl diphosphate synthase, type II
MESPPLFDLKTYLQAKLQQVNDELVQSLPPSESSRIADAMRYSVMAGGKRLRPVLCLAAAEAVGGCSEVAIDTAVAIELIHTYSLIHDDLPAMDDDVLRRGKPTCHVAYGEATAILTGDALLTLAFQMLASQEAAADVPADRRLQIIHAVATAAGYEGMIGGQMTDIDSEGSRIGLSRLEQLHLMKTGALIKAAVTTGGILGGGTSEQIRHLHKYAQNIGLAFQIIDDILNIEGDPALLGKAVGTDEEKKKSTYPALLGLVESRKLAASRVKEALQALEYFDKKADPLRAIAKYVIDRKS